jgi:hypothetical protein
VDELLRGGREVVSRWQARRRHRPLRVCRSKTITRASCGKQDRVHLGVDIGVSHVRVRDKHGTLFFEVTRNT